MVNNEGESIQQHEICGENSGFQCFRH